MSTVSSLQATILVIEDEPAIRAAVADALREAGADARIAATAADAIRESFESQPHLYILDLGLPDKSGVDLCRELRAASDAPIIILSARASEAEKVALLRVGADDYVTKPFSVAELLARCEAHLRRARATARPVDDARNRRVSLNARTPPARRGAGGVRHPTAGPRPG